MVSHLSAAEIWDLGVLEPVPVLHVTVSRHRPGRDARRYDELVSGGFLVLRFTWEQILSDPAWVLAMVRRPEAPYS